MPKWVYWTSHRRPCSEPMVMVRVEHYFRDSQLVFRLAGAVVAVPCKVIHAARISLFHFGQPGPTDSVCCLLSLPFRFKRCYLLWSRPTASIRAQMNGLTPHINNFPRDCAIVETG